MIDTDEYEGHTPVEIWQVVGQGEPEDNGEYGWHIPYWMACNKAKLGNHKADARLIEDAPLLLQALIDERAEVKRLKAKLFEAELWVNNDSYTFENNIKELNRLVKE